MADDMFLRTLSALRADTITDGVLDDLKNEVIWREILLRQIRHWLHEQVLTGTPAADFSATLLDRIDQRRRP